MARFGEIWGGEFVRLVGQSLEGVGNSIRTALAKSGGHRAETARGGA